MTRFILNESIINSLKKESTRNTFISSQEAYQYCPGCSSSGCTGSAQYGCDSCSSCSSWAGGK